MSALEKDAWRITFSEVKAAAEDIIEEARRGRQWRGGRGPAGTAPSDGQPGPGGGRGWRGGRGRGGWQP